MTRTFTLTVSRDGDHYVAHVDDLPGCFASGTTVDELREALTEAIGMCLDGYSVSGVEFEPTTPVQQIRARAELVSAT